jgi:serine/threonine-protein kinase
MADVYRACDTVTGDEVAVKLLRPALSREPRALQRFYREAAILEMLGGGTFPRVFALGFDDARGSAYLAMSLVLGKRLTELCPLPWREAARICAAVARALAVAHAGGIVHRDLKPDNVLVAGRAGAWSVTVMDFGVARRLDEDDPTLTETGAPVGTPSCMAPEQIEGREVDARTDLYALGCLFHRALTGKRLFETDSAEAMLRHHLVTAPAPLGNTLVDEGAPLSLLQALRDRLVAKTPAERPASAAWAAEALERVAQDEALPEFVLQEHALQEPTYPGVKPSVTPPTPRPRGARRAAFVGVALLMVSGAIAAVSAAFGPPSPAPSPELRARAVSALMLSAPPTPVIATAPVPSVATAPELVVATAPDNAMKDAAPLPPPPEASDAAPVTKVVTIVAEPPAVVYQGATRLGTTPLDMEVPAGPPVEVWLRRAGHERKRLSLDESSPARIVVSLPRSPTVENAGEQRTAPPKPWSPQPF